MAVLGEWRAKSRERRDESGESKLGWDLQSHPLCLAICVHILRLMLRYLVFVGLYAQLALSSRSRFYSLQVLHPKVQFLVT